MGQKWVASLRSSTKRVYTPTRFMREIVPEVRHDERPDANPGAAFSPSFDSRRMLEGMDVLGVGCDGAISSEVSFVFVHCLPLSKCFPSLLS